MQNASMYLHLMLSYISDGVHGVVFDIYEVNDVTPHPTKTLATALASMPFCKFKSDALASRQSLQALSGPKLPKPTIQSSPSPASALSPSHNSCQALFSGFSSSSGASTPSSEEEVMAKSSSSSS